MIIDHDFTTEQELAAQEFLFPLLNNHPGRKYEEMFPDAFRSVSLLHHESLPHGIQSAQIKGFNMGISMYRPYRASIVIRECCVRCGGGGRWIPVTNSDKASENDETTLHLECGGCGNLIAPPDSGVWTDSFDIDNSFTISNNDRTLAQLDRQLVSRMADFGFDTFDSIVAAHEMARWLNALRAAMDDYRGPDETV